MAAPDAEVSRAAHAAAVRRALLSVSDKTGLIELRARAARSATSNCSPPAAPRGCWRDAGMPVREVSELHRLPRDHGRPRQDAASEDPRRTARPPRHRRCGHGAARHRAHRPAGGQPLSVRSTRSRDPDCSYAEAIENIDIGGPAMLRAAAKNHAAVPVVVDPADYAAVLAELERTRARSAIATARQAGRQGVRAHGALRHHGGQLPGSARTRCGDERTSPRSCRWCSTRSRTCATARTRTSRRRSIANAGGAAARASATRAHAAGQGPVVQQHRRRRRGHRMRAPVRRRRPASSSSTPTPAAWPWAPRSLEAYERGLPHRPDLGLRRHHRLQPRAGCAPPRSAIIERQFVEVLAAPASMRPRRRLLAAQAQCARALVTRRPAARRARSALEYTQRHRRTAAADARPGAIDARSELNVRHAAASPQPRAAGRSAASPGGSCKFVKSNAIVFARDGATIGVGAGQMSRVYSTRIAAMKAADEKLEVRGSVMASDAFFPFRDGIDVAAALGIRAVIQPGGSHARRGGHRRGRRARHGDGVHRHAALPALIAAMKVLDRRRRRPRARARLEVRAVAARAARCCVAPGQRRHGRTSRRCATSTSPPSDIARPAATCARASSVDLTIVGPEAPLVAGIVDAFAAAGLRCFGPDAGGRAARGLEGLRQGFPAAPRHPDGRYRDLHARRASTRPGVRAQRAPIVVKASGLAAGKGVVIADSTPRRRWHARRRCSPASFGAAGTRGRDRGVPAGRGSELHRHGRRRAHPAARHLAGPQAR